MKKGRDEEHEFEIKVTGYLRGGDKPKASAATVRRLATSIPAPMAVR